MKRPHIRTLILILLLLVCGAIVTIAVAWGCTFRWVKYGPRSGPSGPIPQEVPLSREEIQAIWARLALPGWGGEPMHATQDHLGFGLRRLSAYAGRWTYVERNGQPTTRVKYMISEHAAGWPVLAVRYVWRSDNTNEIVTNHGRLRIPMGSGPPPPPGRVQQGVRAIYLPFLPMWPGFAINTLLYAALLWLLFAAPFALRRWRRLKRGLCPKCAYDLRSRPSDFSPCPECGATS